MRLPLRAFAIVAVLAATQQALAHAFLDHASPRVGSTVHGSPDVVKLWFTQELEPAFSTVRVLDKSGKPVDRGDVHVDKSDRAMLQVSMPPLAPGSYRVRWRVLSVDTHVTEGDFSFDVVP